MAGDIWNAQQYLRFEDDRLRPFLDLVTQLDADGAVHTVVDLGCAVCTRVAVSTQHMAGSLVGGVTRFAATRFARLDTSSCFGEIVRADEAQQVIESAHARKLRRNRGFSGFYDYGAGDLAKFFRPMLADSHDGHAMMVHPGHVDAELRAVDSLTDPREREWAFLMSEDFPAQLAAAGFELAEPGFTID